MKKLNVNKDACIGCGACIAIDPTHFDFDEDGLSHAISNENLDSENVTTAIESCPTNAISIDCEEGCHCGEACECGDDCHCEK